MPIFPFGIFSKSSTEHMTRQAHIDEARVACHAERLVAAGMDRTLFDDALAEFKADKEIAASEIAAVAMRYVGGGKRPQSKKAALSAISTRFTELVRTHKSNLIAEKVRPL
jgi:hypothetical protein